MPQASPLLDIPIEDCDSPSGSSTSEPHDDSMQIHPQPLFDESFFYKLDQVPPDNPLYFMQQQQMLLQQQQQQQQIPKNENNSVGSSSSSNNGGLNNMNMNMNNNMNNIAMSNHGSPATMDEDQSMAEINDSDLGSAASPLQNNIRQPSVERHSPLMQQQQQPLQQLQQQPFIPPTSTSSNNGSIIEPLQPSNSSSAPGQTFWSGVNNFLSNVAQNPFPQAIPNLARNVTDYLSSSYQTQLPGGSMNPISAPQTTSTAVSTHAPIPTPPMMSPNAATIKTENLKTKSSGSGMQIRVLGVPQTGAKSRVETQIKLCIQLVTDDGDKAQWWSHLKLPEHMVAKDKLKRQIMVSTAPNGTRIASVTGVDSNNVPIRPEKLLFLSARVICASDPTRKVVTCLGCIQRERKRSQRRKENRVKAETEEEKRPADDEKSLAMEEQKVLLFNCSELVDFSSGDTILPTRITCYCRHHNERVGFCIYFEMQDHTGKAVASGMSPPIMITDDHKSNKVKAGRKRPRVDAEQPNTQAMLAAAASFGSFQHPQQVSAAQPMQFPAPHPFPNPQLSIQPRPDQTIAPSVTQQQQQQQPTSQQHSPVATVKTSAHVSPLNPAMNMFLQSSQMAQIQQLGPNLFSSLAAAAATTTAGPSSTPKNSTQTPPPPATSPSPAERPLLQRLIPSEGPTYGGIEVTILGTNFRNGLTVMFGDVVASNTHFWSPNTLVCVLPASATPGPVVVSFKEYPVVMDSQEVTLFTYYNENDRALMELALQVVGLKMTGKVEDAREIAMRIVQGGNNQGQQSNGTTSSGGSNGGGNSEAMDSNSTNNESQQLQRQQKYLQQPQEASLERHIIQVLEVMDTMEDVQSSDVSIANAQGHTMLHLAAMLGFTKLTLALLDLNCSVDNIDRNGLTALHYASWFGHEDVVRVLLEEGDADPEIYDLRSKRPMHLAKDNTIRTLLLNHMPLDDRETSESSHQDDSLSDIMSADVDTSYDEGGESSLEEDNDSDYDDEDDDRVWIGSDTEDRVTAWPQAYASDTSTASSEVSLASPTSIEGLRRRRGPQQQQQQNVTWQYQSVGSIQYLQQEEEDSNSADEIPDAQPVHEQDAAVSSSDDEIPSNKKSANWMQRTLSHFQQQKNNNNKNNTHQRSPSGDNSFLQNLKNNIPAKPTDLNLKNIADHLLQLPRPTTMIANMSMSIRLSPDAPNAPKNTSPTNEEPEQTLAWYMALAYAMGVRNSQSPESSSSSSSSSRPNRKHHHISAYPASSASASSSSPSSEISQSYDGFYPPKGLETMEDKKRKDQRLLSFWVPLLVFMVIWLIYQVACSHTVRSLIWWT
ncbi:hypothetical protein BDA99DRAFT_513959 [Phascolomyces articulosus]|uniref:IPT/TIG domain-containing protein n=1 Tax=Phascolomyces articulosus TaxID=60185 RepID=A0AAD5PCU1_9FUNG|nr:hypothetical protein BDA99DRAFT_513959 [Phascolomyces articulosus]